MQIVAIGTLGVVRSTVSSGIRVLLPASHCGSVPSDMGRVPLPKIT